MGANRRRIVRIGHKYHVVALETGSERGIARTAADFYRENEYERAHDLGSRDAFLNSSWFPSWVRDVHEAYKASLEGAGRVLSIGGGIGEHDVLLHLAGVDIVSTDMLEGVSAGVQRLFPDMEFGTLQALDEAAYARFSFDSILITGLDYAMDDESLLRLFAICRRVLSGSKAAVPRLVFTIRYRDNLLTRVIDEGFLPVEAWLRRIVLGRTHKVVRKAHGYRRSSRHVLRMLGEHGFAVRAVRYAGCGVEYGRSAILRRLPLFLTLARTLDRISHAGCNCVVLEMTPS